MKTNFNALSAIRQENLSDTIVFRGGCFDIVHEGHVAALEHAKKLGSLLVVGVRPDRRVAERKGPMRPIRDEQSRLAVIDGLRSVDWCFIMPEGNDELGSSTLRVVDALRPDIFVGSGAFVGSHPNDDKIQAMGTKVYVDTTPPLCSTTSIVERIISAHRLEQ